MYIYILFLKSICSIKEHWWSLTLSWLDEDQRMFSTAHELLNVKLKPQTVLWWFYTKVMTFTLWHFVEIISCLIKNSSSSQLCSFCIYLSLLFLYFLVELYLAHARSLLTPCRFVPVLIPVHGGLGEHSKSLS